MLLCDTTDRITDMTYIRRRNSKAGSLSTALVESYRDEKGRPRQRLLANLYGEPDTVSALAKLEFRLDAMRKNRDELRAEARSEDDKMMVAEFFDDKLAAAENQISTIRKHCSATPDELQAAIAAHK